MPCLKLLVLLFVLYLPSVAFAQVSMPEHGIDGGSSLSKKQAAIDAEIGIIHKDRSSNHDHAIARLQELFRESDKIDYDPGRAKSLLCISHILINFKGEEDATPALAYLRKTQKYLAGASKKNPRLLEIWYLQMGATFLKLSELDSGMFYYSEGLNIGIRKKSNNPVDKLDLAINYLSVESMFFESGQYDKVIYYGRASAKLAAQNNFQKQLYRSYIMMAGAYVRLQQVDSALFYLSSAAGVIYRPEEIDLKMYNEYQGDIALLKKQPEAAIGFYKKAISTNDNSSSGSLKGMGIAYKELGDFRLAENFLLSAKKDLISLKNSKQDLAFVCNHLAELYARTGNYKAAYDNKSMGASLQQVIDNTGKVRMINTLEGQFRKTQQDKQLFENNLQLAQAKSKLTRQKTWIAGIVLLAMLLSAIIIALYQKQKLQRQKMRTAEQGQEIEKLRTAIDAEEKERSRIGRELHDDIMVQLSIVKMNLEALPAHCPEIAAVEDFVAVKELLNVAGRDLRQTAHNLSPDTLLADGLTQALLYFFKNVQYRTKLSINFQHYGETPQFSQEVEINVYRITQELIQNIIKHAQAKNVLIQLNYRQDMLSLTIEDDGIGFDTSSFAGYAGIGLKSIQSRLKVMKGDIDIHNREPHGTSVTIEVYKS